MKHKVAETQLFLKHEKAMDLAVLVHRILWSRDGMDVSGEWINMGFKEGYAIHQPVDFFVKFGKVGNWKYYLGNSKQLREARWQTISPPKMHEVSNG